ncbi:MAG: hypothetical protein IJJ78_02280 [Paludibacteraceae bacterium]|nr:hypothetical protein [Paludibacteraceae bacterium]MBQ7748395.1 hypothetical protein [Paludibacteraceae bacterium]MBR0497893.1 hypothetical protein [Paludibacteraceae bacterium]
MKEILIMAVISAALVGYPLAVYFILKEDWEEAQRIIKELHEQKKADTPPEADEEK